MFVSSLVKVYYDWAEVLQTTEELTFTSIPADVLSFGSSKCRRSCDYANIGFFNSSLAVSFSFGSNNSISVAKVERSNKYPDIYQVVIPCNYTVNSISKIRHSHSLRHFLRPLSIHAPSSPQFFRNMKLLLFYAVTGQMLDTHVAWRFTYQPFTRAEASSGKATVKKLDF